MNATKLQNTDFDKLIIKSIEEVFGFSKSTGELSFAFDQIKSGEFNGDNETVYAEGKQGVQLAALKRKKTTGFTCENGYVIASALAAQLGTTVEEASETNKLRVQRQAYLDVTDDTITLEDTPVNNTIKYIYQLNADQTKKATFALTTDFTVEGKTITLTETAKAKVGDNKTFLVIYDTDVTIGKRIVNDGESYAETVKLVVNMLGEDPCTHASYLIQATMPSADVSGKFTIGVGNDPAVHNFEANALLDVCSQNKELITFVIA